MLLFSVTCTTCRAKLSVKNVAAIGQILGCPKCGGMVQVLAPPGWQPPSQEQAPSATPGSQTTGLKAEDSGTTPQTVESKPAPTSDAIAANPGTWSNVPADATDLDSAARSSSADASNRFGKGIVLPAAIAAGIAAVLLLSAFGVYRWNRSSADSTVAPKADVAQQPDVAKVDAVPTPATKQEPAVSITETEMTTLEKPAADVTIPANSLPEKNLPAQAEVAANAPVAASQPATPPPAASTPATPGAEVPASAAKEDAPVQVSTAKDLAPPAQAAPPVAVAPEISLPEPKRLPLRDDIAQRLADKLPQIELRDIPLIQALRIVSQLSTLPVTLDLDALSESQVDIEGRVSIKLNDSTVAQILTTVLEQQQLVFVVEEDQIVATTPQRRQESRKTQQYDVADLPGLQPQFISGLLRQIVAPASWFQAGGRGTIQVAGNNLIVEQSSAVHRQVQSLLDRLRLARDKSVSSAVGGPSELLVKFTPARSKLAQTVSVNFHEDTSLARILEYLEQVGELRIAMDLPALAHAGVSADSPFNLTADRQPLSAALTALLQPRGLTYRIYNDRTLQVTSLRAERQNPEVEIYKVADLAANSTATEELAGRIKAQVSPATWRESGGTGVIAIDPSVPCLIVSQTQAIQRQVQEWLGNARASNRPIKP